MWRTRLTKPPKPGGRRVLRDSARQSEVDRPKPAVALPSPKAAVVATDVTDVTIEAAPPTPPAPTAAAADLALQQENESLRREVEALRAEVEALRGENRKLKAAQGGPLSDNEEEEALSDFLRLLAAVLEMRTSSKFDVLLFDQVFM